jgi:hypothetical protein
MLAIVPLQLCAISAIILSGQLESVLALNPMPLISSSYSRSARERVKSNPFSTFRLNLNRIFAELHELRDDDSGGWTLQLQKDDYRAKHISEILKLKKGDNIKTGCCIYF